MFKDLVVKNRSYRKFMETPRITREQMASYVDTARFAPASVNIQPLKYRLVSDPAECAALFPLTGWARMLPDFPGPAEGHRPTGYVLICCDTQLAENVARFNRDIGIAAQTIMLAAVADGFGGCMIGNFPALDLQQALELPQTIAPMLVVALGKPDETVVLTELPESGAESRKTAKVCT